jgi:hypothetical protein
MDGTELAAFEQLLVESQSARERVAEMVALTQSVAQCGALSDMPPHTVPATAGDVAARRAARRFAISRSIAWLGVSAAVVVAAILLGRQVPNRDDTASSPSATEERQVELAAAWASWLDDSVGDGVARGDGIVEYHSAEAPGAAVGVDEPPDSALDERLDAPLDAPDWMLAALGGEEITSDAAPDAAKSDYDDMETDPLDDDGARDG